MTRESLTSKIQTLLKKTLFDLNSSGDAPTDTQLSDRVRASRGPIKQNKNHTF